MSEERIISDTTMKEFCEFLKTKRMAKNCSQYDFVAFFPDGKGRTVISKLEHGTRELDLEMLVKYLAVCEISDREILEWIHRLRDEAKSKMKELD
ncbi:MAG: helix-turn-helix transcriptional regulator [Pseudobutyrivibrio sp.]|nr:helix-turn-helix transcriptional regulator [Pseudobutyrivibrio sp.]